MVISTSEEVIKDLKAWPLARIVSCGNDVIWGL